MFVQRSEFNSGKRIALYKKLLLSLLLLLCTSLCPCLSHTPPCVRVCLTHLRVSVSVSHVPVPVSVSHLPVPVSVSHLPVPVSVSHLPASMCILHTSLCVYLTHLPMSLSISHTSRCPCLTPPRVHVSHLPVSVSHTLCPCLTPPCVRVSHLPGPRCRFISLSNERHAEIEDTHSAVTKTLEQIRQENEMAIKLKKQLEHEMVVLEERKAVRG